MPETLTIAVAQPLTVPHDVAANAAAHARAVRSARARVVVFPELSLTGYEPAAATLAPGDARLEPLVAACAETGAVALAGAPVDGDGDGGGDSGPSIAMLAVDGSGVTVAYRKMYLGAEEALRFAPGSRPRVLEVDGWRLGLAVCKDTGVPEHAAATAGLGIDVYVAGTVKHAHEAELQAERARGVAAGHGVWVAVASFAGPTGGGFAETAGRSGVWAPGGEPVAQAGPEIGAVLTTTLTTKPATKPF
ncbi:carbon-nitrogen hydrolase family protein [Nonomuraea roseoviolacea]|uniref:Amidohydrolase n=1 Tax=Nonomuraea roseoviolacea subsp. carminata TaxID=160689 RepID=A0ABT1KAK8_9ACTN|nr:carbon-nitrogen hydrolase family protein [Nonomuraea roseoviolacea]MCP2351046.1 putative amidohydrolase [Nonomuraea roseoviolacea subsp. carminata]